MDFSFEIRNSQNSLTPNMELEKQPLGKGKTSTNHQFSGSMLVFRDVSYGFQLS